MRRRVWEPDYPCPSLVPRPHRPFCTSACAHPHNRMRVRKRRVWGNGWRALTHLVPDIVQTHPHPDTPRHGPLQPIGDVGERAGPCPFWQGRGKGDFPRRWSRTLFLKAPPLPQSGGSLRLPHPPRHPLTNNIRTAPCPSRMTEWTSMPSQ